MIKLNNDISETPQDADTEHVLSYIMDGTNVHQAIAQLEVMDKQHLEKQLVKRIIKEMNLMEL